MSTVTDWGAGTDSMPEIPNPSGDRLLDIELKHEQVAKLLADCDADALLLQRPETMSWLSSGAEFERGSTGQCIAALFVTADARVVVTSNDASHHIFTDLIGEMGFQLKERPWNQPRRGLVEDLCRGRKIISDTGCGRTRDVSPELQSLRVRLTPLDRERLLVLTQMVVHAVEATARTFQAGQTEAELAGEMSHRLVKRRVKPIELQVHADGVQEEARIRSAGTRPLERFGVMSAAGKRWGLTAAAARTVCFGEMPDDLRRDHEHVLLLTATAARFSLPEWSAADVWKRVARIYEKFGCKNEWRLAEQGWVLGGQYREQQIAPRADFQLKDGMPLYWGPSVGISAGGNTSIVGPRGAELLGVSDLWPLCKVEVKGTAIHCPSVLQRTHSGS